MNRGKRLTGLLAAAALASVGLLAAASAASAGTYQEGSWELIAPGGGSYQAQVQQPINADGSSVFSAKSRTIPVKWKVTQTSKFAFESVVNGDSGVIPGSDTGYSVAHLTMPSGVTIGDLTNLTADFNWAFGENHSGGFRWQVEVMYNGQQQNIMVDYGDASNSLQSGTEGSGVNMINSTLASQNRDESSQVGGTLYTPWSYVVSNFGSLPVVGVDLVVDGGWGQAQPGGTHDQVINLTDANVGWNGGSSTFTFPAPTTGAAVNPSTVPMYVYLYEVSGNTPGQVVDEQITSTQGDTGGQYRAADGMYMYNFLVSNLPDKSATYKIGISPNSDGSSPFATVPFGTK